MKPRITQTEIGQYRRKKEFDVVETRSADKKLDFVVSHGDFQNWL